MYVYMCSCIHTHTHLYTRPEVRGQWQVSASVVISLTGTSTHQFGWTPYSQKAPGILRSPSAAALSRLPLSGFSPGCCDPKQVLRLSALSVFAH